MRATRSSGSPPPTMLSIFQRLARDEQGATLVEYGLLITLIAVAAIAAMITLGGNISTMFSNDAAEVV